MGGKKDSNSAGTDAAIIISTHHMALNKLSGLSVPKLLFPPEVYYVHAVTKVEEGRLCTAWPYVHHTSSEFPFPEAASFNVSPN